MAAHASNPASLAARHEHLMTLRAPTTDGAALHDPPESQARELIAANRQQLDAADCEVGAMALGALRQQARLELLAAARRYTASYRGDAFESARPEAAAPIDDTAAPLLIAGHQPQMFHPGVWLKNFSLARMATEVQGTAINLVIDSDTLKSVALRVPTGSIDNPRAESLLFDAPAAEIAYEDRPWHNSALSASFGERVCEALRPLLNEPLIAEYWPLVMQRAAQTDNVGCSLAQARHQLEAAWGVATLELPVSGVCRLPVFQRFVYHLLSHGERLAEVHNRQLLAYRQQYGIRSTHHPVAALEQRGAAYEVPLWVWSRSAPRRRRVFAERGHQQWLLSDGGSWQCPVPDDPQGCSEALTALEARGVRLRPRAILTTMFARLVLGDLFVHGLGGGKYDTLTDAIMGEFFGVGAPQFMVTTGTLRLPIRHQSISAAALAHERAALRESLYHPERFLTPETAEAAAPWIAEKERWLATDPVPKASLARHQGIAAANVALRQLIEPQRQAMERRLAQIEPLRRHSAVFESREYAFCLYKADILRDFLLAIPAARP